VVHDHLEKVVLALLARAARQGTARRRDADVGPTLLLDTHFPG
jgi:hypothetical protein